MNVWEKLLESLRKDPSYKPADEKEKALFDDAVKAIEKENSDEAVDKLANKLVDSFAKAMAEINKEAGANSSQKQKAMKGAGDNTTEGKELSKEEKIVKFFVAVAKKDETQIKALAEGTDADGGYLVPTEFRAEVVRDLNKRPTAIRSRARVFPMSRDTLELPKVTSEVQVFWGTENQSMSTTTAQFGNVQLTAHRLNAILRTSRELVNDASVSVVNLIVEMFADAVATAENTAFLTGNGSGKPKGVTAYTLKTVSGALGVSLINSMYWRLPQVYRANAVWVMNSADIETLTGVKDTTGRPIIQEATEGGLPTIKGRPVLEINQLTAGTIVFGDWRHYFVGDRERMSVETSTEEGNSFARHQIAIKVVERLDGKLALTNAFVKGSIN